MSLVKLDSFEIDYELADDRTWEAFINGDKFLIPVTTESVIHNSTTKFLVDTLYWLATEAYWSEDELDVRLLYRQIVKFIKLTDYGYFKKLTNPVYNLYRRTKGVKCGSTVYKLGVGLSMFTIENRIAHMLPEFTFR